MSLRQRLTEQRTPLDRFCPHAQVEPGHDDGPDYEPEVFALHALLLPGMLSFRPSRLIYL